MEKITARGGRRPLSQRSTGRHQGSSEELYTADHGAEWGNKEACVTPFSFMSANYVARSVGYHMTGGWAQGEQATNQFYEPVDTFPQRFEEILLDVRAMGFDALDIWMGHLNWAWATPAHVVATQSLLDRHGLRVVSLAGNFGSTAHEFEAACKLAVAVGTDVLGGSTELLERDRDAMLEILRRYRVRLAIENHPERTPQEMLAKLGDGAHCTIGTAVDTGWYAIHGYDAALAIRELGEHVFHVHLKDISESGGHASCRFGAGIVPLEECVSVLRETGYRGALSVEHEPPDRDPAADCTASLETLRDWCAA